MVSARRYRTEFDAPVLLTVFASRHTGFELCPIFLFASAKGRREVRGNDNILPIALQMYYVTYGLRCGHGGRARALRMWREPRTTSLKQQLLYVLRRWSYLPTYLLSLRPRLLRHITTPILQHQHYHRSGRIAVILLVFLRDHHHARR